ncbi:MAG: hypothetical protein ACOYJB_06570 [Christensenellaceae bacterium]
MKTIDGVSGKLMLEGIGYDGNSNTNKMLAEVNVHLEDKLSQLTPPSSAAEYYFYVTKHDRVDTQTIETYPIPALGVPVDITQTLLLDRYYDYTVELYVKINNRLVQLDEIEFATDDEVIGLRVIEDFKKLGNESLHPGGRFKNYIVLNDIDFTEGPWNYDSNPFEGTLDFQGFKATFNGVGNYLFYNLGRNGVVKNIEVEASMTNTDPLSYRAFIAYRNFGTISNVNFTYKGSTAEVMNWAFGLIAYANYPGAVIENFAIYVENPIYARSHFGCAAYYNEGTVRNGAVYGNTYKYNATEETWEGDIIVPDKMPGVAHDIVYLGGVVGYNYTSGRVENVYSLLNIRVGYTGASPTPANRYYERVGTVVGYNLGMTANTYTTGEVGWQMSTDPLDMQRDLRYGPAVGSQATRNQTERTYYVSLYRNSDSQGNIYSNAINLKLTRDTLVDQNWHTNLLGNQFDTSAVATSYFPLVKLSPRLPRMHYIPLPMRIGANIDIASVIVSRQFEDYADVVFTFKNPSAQVITRIVIDGLEAEVVEGEQYDTAGLSRVQVRVKPLDQSDPAAVFKSAYTVTSFYSRDISIPSGLGSQTYTPTAPLCEAEFFRSVNTVDEWVNIKTKPTENHRVKATLDFTGRPITDIRITGTYSGKLDGGIYVATNTGLELTGMQELNNITISSTATSDANGVIHQLTGTASNFVINNMTLDYPNASYTGFVRDTNAGAVLDNLHFRNATIATQGSGILGSSRRIGVAAGRLLNGEMRNCSVTGTSKIIDTRHTDPNIGGLVGLASFARIFNSYTYGLEIEIQNGQYALGTGGIVGRGSNTEIDSVYSAGSILTTAQNNGGIAGYFEGATTLNKSWSDVKIHSRKDRIGGLVGHDTTTTTSVLGMNSLVLSELSSSVTGSGYLHRGVGNNTNIGAIYAWEGQRVNGAVPKDLSLNVDPDGTTIATEADLRNERYYTRQIRMGSGFNYDNVANFNMPWLYREDGTELLPFQELHTPTDPEIIVQRVEGRLTGEYNLYIEFLHDASITIEDIEVEEIVMIRDDLQRMTQADGKVVTAYTGHVDQSQIGRYWDAYELGSVVHDGGQKKQVYAQVDFGAPITKEINNANDWYNELFGAAGRAETYENFLLMGDIDFDELGAAQRANFHGIKINRLRGSGMKEIRDITTDLSAAANAGESLIGAINKEINNITFSNIEIKFGTNANFDNSGVIGNMFGEVTNTNFYNIKITGGNSYNGCFGYILGDVKNVNITDFWRERAGGSFVGALAGAVQDSKISGVTLTSSNPSAPTKVYGASYVGGITGYALRTIVENCDVSHVDVYGTSGYVGGVAGYCNGSVAGDGVVNKNLKVSNTRVRGALAVASANVSSSYVGGIFGVGSLRNPSVLERSTVTNSVIIGGNRVGGLSGQHNTWYNAYGLVDNTYVFGAAYVGGNYGYSPQIRNNYTNKAVVSTIYDDWFSQWSTTGQGTDAAAKGIAQSPSWMYSTASDLPTARINNPQAGYNMLIGGIGAWRVATGSGVRDSLVGGTKAEMVGGLIGEGWDAETNYNHVTNTTIKGGSMVGGITGKQRYRAIQVASVVNSTVTATGDYGGGVAGYIIGSQILNGTNLGRVSGVYVVGTSIYARDYAGGIFGYTTGQYFDPAGTSTATNNNIRFQNKGLLSLASRIETTGFTSVNADFFGIIGDSTVKPIRGRVFNDVPMYVGGVGGPIYPFTASPSTYQVPYDDKYLGGGNWNGGSAVTDADRLLRVGTAELQQASTTSNSRNNENFYSRRLGNQTPSAYDGEHFDNRYFNHTDVASGYLPRVRSSSGGTVLDYQQQITIPTNTNPLGESAGPDMLTDDDFAMATEPQVLPVADFYAAGSDKLNIDFDYSNEYTYFTVEAGNTLLVPKTKIDSRTFTLNYDFNSQLTVTVGDGYSEESYTVKARDVRHTVMTWANDYYFIVSQGIHRGNAEVLPGYYINLAGGEALHKDGSIYEIIDGKKVREFEGIGLADKTALQAVNYDGFEIRAYKNYSTSEKDGVRAYRDFRMIVKNGMLSILDTNLDTIFDGLIVDTAGDQSYMTVLGSNGVITNLMNEIVFPDGFENSGIVEMSNNLNAQTPYVIVRYDSGAVLAFNYLTGEVKDTEDVTSDKSLVEYAADFFERKAGELYSNASEGYIKYTKLKDSILVTPADNLNNGPSAIGDSDVKGTGDTGIIGGEAQDGINGAAGSSAGGDTTAGGDAFGGAEGEAQDGVAAGDAAGLAESGSGDVVDGTASGDTTVGSSNYLPVYDAELGEYVLYDKADMLGGEVGEGTANDDNITADASLTEEEVEEEKLTIQPIRITNEVVEQQKTFFDGDNTGIIWILVMIGVVAVMLIYIFDRRNKADR